MEHRQHAKAWMPTLSVSWMKMNSHSYQVSTKAPIIHPTPTPFIPLMMTPGLNYTSTWSGAQTTCEGMNANLVSILDENEQSFLSSKYQSTNHTPHPPPRLFLSWWPWGLTIHPHGMEHRQHAKAWMPTLSVSWMKMNSHSYQVSTKAPIIHPTPTPIYSSHDDPGA